jgi:SNF2 family DNA or RNA helicase
MFEYQEEALEWMKIREIDRNVRGGFLCHEMGLGKTRMMSILIKEHLVPFTLILTTKTTVGSWLAELRLQSQFKFDCLEYKKNETVITPGRPTVLVATHHSVLKRNNRHFIQTLGHTWFEDQTINRLIVDEAHILRNRSGSLFRDIQDIESRIRWGITATPYNNSNADIKAYTEFLKRELPASAFNYYMCRKTRKEVDKGGRELVCSKHVYNFESEEELRMYEYVSGRIDDVNDWIANNAYRLPRHVQGLMRATMILRQRQAAIHPQMVLDAEKVWRAQMPMMLGNPEDVGSWDPSKVTKFRHILDIVKRDQQKGESTMIVTHFKTELDLLKQLLESSGIQVKVLNGKTRPKERTKLEKHGNPITEAHVGGFLDRIHSRDVPNDIIRLILSYIFQPCVLLLQIKAGGVGISLPWVHHVINTSPDWNPFLELQAIYRAYRINTKHNVRVTSMYFRNTIDTNIQQRQSLKFKESLKWTGDDPKSISEFIHMPE